MKKPMRFHDNFTTRLVLAAGTSLALAAGGAFAQSAGFAFLGALSNVITPNGDSFNDVAILCFDNPKFSEVSGTIFDLRGNKVSGLAYEQSPLNCPAGTNSEKLKWDGKADGRTVPGGVYIYQVQSEGHTVTGTVMVVR